MSKIRFYITTNDALFASIPSRIEDYWDWQCSSTGVDPYWGKYHWVLQSYLYLRHAGFDCELVNRFPPTGILITHMDCLDYGHRPGRDQYLVALLVDREVPHPYAQIHVTHNPCQILPLGLSYEYLSPWPQVGLLPRDDARGDTFNRVGYFGYPANLDPALSDASFRERLAQLGLELIIKDPTEWHDFRDVDAILAIRTFGRDVLHLNKPALKLYNAWLARVPAVLGFEAAYRAEGKPNVNYLEATSLEEALSALGLLARDLHLRRNIVARGLEVAARYSPDQTLFRWTHFLEAVVQPGYERWRGKPTLRAFNRLSGAIKERVLWRRPGYFLHKPIQ